VTADARPVVVGAGWSGLACAVTLVQGGLAPVVLDAGLHPGGRARVVAHQLGGTRLELDNGQHLLLGAYEATLAMMRAVGADPARLLHETPFAIAYPDGWRLSAARAPAPLHLLLGLVGAQGVSTRDRLALAGWVARQQLGHWSAATGASAADVLCGHPAGLVRRLWRPLCLAALNVELEAASGQIFLRVLADSLGAGERASRMLLARTHLSALFPDPAIGWLAGHGAELHLGSPALALRQGGSGYEVHSRPADFSASHVVLALPPERAADLLEGLGEPARCATSLLRAIEQAPICTSFLRYAPGTRLQRPYFALLDDASSGAFGQWIFDRGAIDPALDGVLAVVISGRGAHLALPRDEVERRIVAQVRSTFGFGAPEGVVTFVDKHATIIPSPGLSRPATRIEAPGIYLAGDAADSPYPSTIEGSVRSGIRAAWALLEDLRGRPR
jgi:hydroxysqualene dehydroxylase